MQLPIADSVAIRLANEATALFSAADTFPSGVRHCLTLPPGTESERCALMLRVRRDVADFGPDRIPGGFVVIGAIENTGDLTESRTRIPAGVLAYLLVEQGNAQRARGWYFRVNSGGDGSVVGLHTFAYVACEHPSTPVKPLAAWRGCSDPSPTTAEFAGPLLHRHDLPAWTTCISGCCAVD